MKLGYEFKQYDYVVCTGLDEEQINAILNRMVECGATLYDTYENFIDAFDTLYWDAGDDTYFEHANYWSGSDISREVKWEDIVKTEIKTKTLREMYPNGMYTDNSPEVFERFKELLQSDLDKDDELGFDLPEDEMDTSSGLGVDVVPPQSIGRLIEQIQINTYPNSPRVVIDSDGNSLLRGAGIKVSVSGKSAEDIDKIYQALYVLMQEV